MFHLCNFGWLTCLDMLLYVTLLLVALCLSRRSTDGGSGPYFQVSVSPCSSLDSTPRSSRRPYLPTIILSLSGRSLYIWTMHGYFLTTACIQPLMGQDRRYLRQESPHDRCPLLVHPGQRALRRCHVSADAHRRTPSTGPRRRGPVGDDRYQGK
ncbi:hypothetical protein F4778DRAFT_210810 [Xylariomycetidae sp. FL2044]|nr:hypothetical protein F4778DRAFT_210810 [Xylariomycetidae sp. FL2044]